MYGLMLLFPIDQYEFSAYNDVQYIGIHNFGHGTHCVTNLSLQISSCKQQNWGVGLEMRPEVI